MKRQYESTEVVESQKWRGVRFTVRRMSFQGRIELMAKIRDLARRVEFWTAGEKPEEQMDAGVLQAEIDGIYLNWGLTGVAGLEIDGKAASPNLLIENGPEELVREALDAVKAGAGLTAAERKN